MLRYCHLVLTFVTCSSAKPEKAVLSRITEICFKLQQFKIILFEQFLKPFLHNTLICDLSFLLLDCNRVVNVLQISAME